MSSTHKVLLQLLHLLLVALQPAVEHGSALDRDLPHLQVHLFHLQTHTHAHMHTVVIRDYVFQCVSSIHLHTKLFFFNFCLSGAVVVSEGKAWMGVERDG